MATTPENIRSFFNLIGKQVTNQHLLKVQEALATQRYGFEEDGVTPRTPTSDDLIDWLYRHTENSAKAAVEIPPEDLL